MSPSLSRTVRFIRLTHPVFNRKWARFGRQLNRPYDGEGSHIRFFRSFRLHKLSSIQHTPTPAPAAVTPARAGCHPRKRASTAAKPTVPTPSNIDCTHDTQNHRADASSTCPGLSSHRILCVWFTGISFVNTYSNYNRQNRRKPGERLSVAAYSLLPAGHIINAGTSVRVSSVTVTEMLPSVFRPQKSTSRYHVDPLSTDPAAPFNANETSNKRKCSFPVSSSNK